MRTSPTCLRGTVTLRLSPQDNQAERGTVVMKGCGRREEAAGRLRSVSQGRWPRQRVRLLLQVARRYKRRGSGRARVSQKPWLVDREDLPVSPHAQWLGLNGTPQRGLPDPVSLALTAPPSRPQCAACPLSVTRVITRLPPHGQGSLRGRGGVDRGSCGWQWRQGGEKGAPGRGRETGGHGMAGHL